MLSQMKKWLELRCGIRFYELSRDPGEKLRVFVLYSGEHRSLRIEHHPKGGFSFVIDLHPKFSEESVSGHFSLPFFGSLYYSVYLSSLSGILDRFIKPDGVGLRSSRRFGFQLYEDVFWIYIYEPDGSWSRSDPWWQHITISWKDILLGKQSYSCIETEPLESKVFFPEKLRTAQVTYSESTWSRPRWPWDQHSRCYNFDFKDDPIPIPGKGENSWDCGNDAVYSMSIRVESWEDYPEAVKRLQDDINKTRQNRGGSPWSFGAMLLRRGEQQNHPPD